MHEGGFRVVLAHRISVGQCTCRQQLPEGLDGTGMVSLSGSQRLRDLWW